MKQISNKEYEKHRQCLTDHLHGRTLTPGGLRIICASLDEEPERIGKHMPVMPAKLRSERIVQQLGKRGTDVSTELILFKSGDIALSVPITPDRETVWLTQDQMSELFDTARSSIAYHIGRIFSEGELNRDTSVEIFDRSSGNASRPPMYYNLDRRS